MYEEETEKEITKLSRINSAGLINLRLHRLWEDCNKHSREGKFLAWNGDLDRIWCELVGDVEEGKETDKKFDKINDSLKKSSPLKNWKLVDGFRELEKDDFGKKEGQFNILIKKERFLRTLQNKQGKGSAYQDSIEDYMDE